MFVTQFPGINFWVCEYFCENYTNFLHNSYYLVFINSIQIYVHMKIILMNITKKLNIICSFFFVLLFCLFVANNSNVQNVHNNNKNRFPFIQKSLRKISKIYYIHAKKKKSIKKYVYKICIKEK